MDDKHDIALELNEKVLSLIKALSEHFEDYKEVEQDLRRVSKYLVLKSLKTFEDEKNINYNL